MPFGIRPSNVRVCHSTTRASVIASVEKLPADSCDWQVSIAVFYSCSLSIKMATKADYAHNHRSEIITICD
jgi:hypothetical protein